MNRMPHTEIAHGPTAFYMDKDGNVHFVSHEEGEKKAEALQWIQISKEEAIAHRKSRHLETVGLPAAKEF